MIIIYLCTTISLPHAALSTVISEQTNCFALSFRSATLLGLSKGRRPHLFLYFISYILSMCQYTTQSDKDEEVNYIKQKYVYN